MRCPRHIYAAAAALLLLSTVSGGCTEVADEIQLSRVPPPPGGTAHSISVLQTDDQSSVVAPVGPSVYSRRGDRDAWTGRRANWPEGWKQTAASPLEGIRWSTSSSNFPARRRFTTHDGRIWMLTYHQPSDQPQLLVSEDRGASWSTAPLPSRHSGAARAPSASESTRLTRMGAQVPLRLSEREDRLYLLDKQHVWRAVTDESGSLEEWKSVDVSNNDKLGPDASTALPNVVRNYLPASERRGFELLTVFGDRLYVYRRSSGADRWLLVSTLPTVDLELYAPAGTDMLYLLAPEALYRSDERGERWEKSRLVPPGRSPPQHRAAAFFQQPEAPDAAPPVIVVGTDEGSIYRSADGGSSWNRVRPPDPDSRSITGLVVEPDADRIWASTEGLGVLVSRDGGNTWERGNDNQLRATRPLAMEKGLNDELLLGTEAGLYRLTGAPEDGHWDPLHNRAASAVEADFESARVISGTLGGAIITDRGNAESVVSNPFQGRNREAPLFRPWNSTPDLRNQRTILSLDTRPESETLYAWSHQRGVAFSPDGGTSWRKKPLHSALVSALRGSLIDDFAAGNGENLYFTSHGFAVRSPDQLWHSPEGGEVWSTVATFPATEARHPILLQRRPSDESGTIHLARGSRLNRSVDGGNSWREIPGPWTAGSIRAYRLDGSGHTIAFNTPRATRVAFASELDAAAPEVTAYTVVWSGGEIRPRSGIREALRIGDILMLMTDRALYAGNIPQGEARLPNAPAIIGTLVFVFVLAGVSFWYLRFEI